MATVIIIVGGLNVLYGLTLILWTWLAREPVWIAWFGLMFVGIGGVFLVGNVLPPGGPAYAAAALLAVLTFWSGWRSMKLNRSSRA